MQTPSPPLNSHKHHSWSVSSEDSTYAPDHKSSLISPEDDFKPPYNDISPPSTLSLPFTPTWRDIRTYVALILATLVVVTNSLLTAYYLMGSTFSVQSSLLDEHRPFILGTSYITLVNLGAKVLEVIVVILGGWTVSQMLGRKLSSENRQDGPSPTIIQLQSLNLFHNPIASLRVLFSLMRSRFSITSDLSFVLLVIPALLFQVTRGYWTDPFMSSSHLETLCSSSSSSQTCVNGLLAADSYSNGLAFYQQRIGSKNGSSAFTFTTSPSTSPSTSTSMILDTISIGGSSAAILYGANYATLDAVNSIWQDDLKENIIDLNLNTQVPILISQCVQQEPASSNSTTLEIGNSTYILTSSVPTLQPNTIFVQTTMDEKSMILSLGISSQATTTNVHCAVDLAIVNATLHFQGDPLDGTAKMNKLSYDSLPWPTTTSSSNIYSNFLAAQYPLSTFTSSWMKGLGLSSNSPTTNTIPTLISSLNLSPISSSTNNVTPTIESFILSLLSSPISHGFPTEDPDHLINEPTFTPSFREFTVNITQYYLGLRNPLRIFLLFIVNFMSLVVLSPISLHSIR
ncbi:hypothetical protein ABKN59_011611 [Abortiporus biennis]